MTHVDPTSVIFLAERPENPMRTYDKLIATIGARQSTGGLRPSFGSTVVRCAGSIPPLRACGRIVLPSNAG